MHLAMPLQRMEWLGFAACAAVLALLASSLLLRLARDRTLRHTLHAGACSAPHLIRGPRPGTDVARH